MGDDWLCVLDSLPYAVLEYVQVRPERRQLSHGESRSQYILWVAHALQACLRLPLGSGWGISC